MRVSLLPKHNGQASVSLLQRVFLQTTRAGVCLSLLQKSGPIWLVIPVFTSISLSLGSKFASLLTNGKGFSFARGQRVPALFFANEQGRRSSLFGNELFLQTNMAGVCLSLLPKSGPIWLVTPVFTAISLSLTGMYVYSLYFLPIHSLPTPPPPHTPSSYPRLALGSMGLAMMLHADSPARGQDRVSCSLFCRKLSQFAGGVATCTRTPGRRPAFSFAEI